MWGWDLGKSNDWTVGTGMDDLGEVVEVHRFQLPWNETIERIHKITKKRPALVDSTGLGDPVLEVLQREQGSRYEGYLFGAASKQKLMEGLAVAIQQQTIKLQHEESNQKSTMRMELEIFEYVYTRTGVRYSAPEGYHDDCVCSLALAVEHRVRATMPMNIPSAVLARSAAMGQRRFG